MAERMLWGAAVVGLLAIGWTMVCTVPGIPWNPARLAPSFALARGLPIYALRESGAHLGWFYGPVFPLWFLPVGFVENPTLALMLATVWNAATIVLPIFFVVRKALGGRTPMAAKLTVVGAGLLVANPTMQGSFYLLHVDALCVAMVLAACTALQAGVGRGWRPGLPVAALGLALAIGTKQVAVMAVPATMVWLGREGHGTYMLRWIFWLIVCGGSVAGSFMAVFGAEELFFNGWLVLSRMPWEGGGEFFVARGGALLRDMGVWWLALALGWWVLRPVARGGMGAEAGALARLLGWAAVWQAPLGLAAAMRFGGGLNSVHAQTYFLVAGLIVAGALLVRCEEIGGAVRSWRVVVALGVIVPTGLWVSFRSALGREIVWWPQRGQEALLVRAKASAGKLYLPWNPLVTIIADRKIYPFDDALKVLWVAKLEPPVEAIKAAIPPEAVVYFEEPSQSKFVLNYFGPEARKDAFPKRKP